MKADGRRLGFRITIVFAVAFALWTDELGVTEDVLLVLFVLAATAANLYGLFYWFRPWRSTAQGEALTVKNWGNMILLNLGFCTLAFGEDYWGRDFFRVLGLTAFTIGLWYLLISLLTAPGACDYPPRSWFRRRR